MLPSKNIGLNLLYGLFSFLGIEIVFMDSFNLRFLLLVPLFHLNVHLVNQTIGDFCTFIQIIIISPLFDLKAPL